MCLNQVFELGTASTVDNFFSGTWSDPSGLTMVCNWYGTDSSPTGDEIDYRGLEYMIMLLNNTDGEQVFVLLKN